MVHFVVFTKTDGMLLSGLGGMVEVRDAVFVNKAKGLCPFETSMKKIREFEGLCPSIKAKLPTGVGRALPL